MINLALLNHALAIADEGSFAAAAKSLGLSQPTLSRQIGALELALGLRLFDRGRHGAIPTPLGRQVLTGAARLVRGAELLDREIDLLRGVEVGELKVGAGVYPSFISMGKALGRLASSHPRLQVTVTVEDWRTLANEVLEAKLDLAIAELSEYVEDPRLQLEHLPAHPLAFVCRPGHPLLTLPRPTPADIFRYPFAGTRIASRAITWLEDKPTAGRIDRVTGEYVPSVEVNTIRMVVEVVSESDAFGIVPLSAVNDLARGGRLQEIPLWPAWLKSNYGFITLHDRTLSPAASAFMREVRAVELEMVAEEMRMPGSSGRTRQRTRQPSRAATSRKRSGGS